MLPGAPDTGARRSVIAAVPIGLSHAQRLGLSIVPRQSVVPQRQPYCFFSAGV